MVRGGSMRRSSPPPGGRAGGMASSSGRRPGALGLDHGCPEPPNPDNGRRPRLLRLRLGHRCSRLQSWAIRAWTPLLPPPVLTDPNKDSKSEGLSEAKKGASPTAGAGLPSPFDFSNMSSLLNME